MLTILPKEPHMRPNMLRSYVNSAANRRLSKILMLHLNILRSLKLGLYTGNTLAISFWATGITTSHRNISGSIHCWITWKNISGPTPSMEGTYGMDVVPTLHTPRRWRRRTDTANRLYRYSVLSSLALYGIRHTDELLSSVKRWRLSSLTAIGVLLVAQEPSIKPRDLLTPDWLRHGGKRPLSLPPALPPYLHRWRNVYTPAQPNKYNTPAEFCTSTNAALLSNCIDRVRHKHTKRDEPIY